MELLRQPVANNRRALAVAYKERHHEIQKLIRPLEEYRWHDEKNKIAAFHAAESYAYAAMNRFYKQVAMYKRNAVALFNKDKAEKTVDIGKRNKIPIRHFAVHQAKPGEKQCIIKGDKFSWQLHHIDKSNEPVPAVYLKRNLELARIGIRFDSHAVAVPHEANYIPMRYALKHKASQTMKEIRKCAGRVGHAAVKGIKKTAPAFAVAGAAASTAMVVSNVVMAGFLTDPVFIGIYGNDIMFMIEIGRWD